MASQVELHRSDAAQRISMLAEDIERIKTAATAEDRDRAAIDAQSALGHLFDAVNGLLAALNLPPLPDE